MSKVIARAEQGSKPAHRASGRSDPDVLVEKGVPPGDGQKGPATAEQRRRGRIAEAAFFLAERRGFACGCELDDWLMAERNIDAAPAQPKSGTAAGREG